MSKQLPLCKYCGAKIMWVETASGARMPVDPDLVWSDDCDHGDKLVTLDGRVVVIDQKQEVESVEGYVSHFATCPKADEARKTRRKGDDRD